MTNVIAKKNTKKKKHAGQFVLHIAFILISLCYVLPLLMCVTISVSDSATISTSGFSIFPREISFDTFKSIFQKPDQIISAYGVTIFFTIVTTLGSLLFQATCAYSLSRRDFIFRGPITMILFFTTLFGGGMVPNYILMTRYLGLQNSIWAYIVPSVVSVWNIIVLRTNFQGIPDSLVEAGIMDGAGEWRICFTIVLPLCTPALASIGFLTFIAKWNDWMTTDLYIQSMDLYSLQFLLQKLLQEVEFAKQLAQQGLLMGEMEEVFDIPSEAYRFAMALVAMGPAILVFPFFQKYFAKGLTLGAVKG